MFKVGDKVKCIDNTEAEKHLILDKVYIISEKVWGTGTIRLNETKHSWFESRFTKVNDMTDASKVFMVYNTTNKGTPRVTHNTFEDAKNEANRLATANPNHEFLVLEATYAVKRIPQYVTEERSFNISH